MSGAGADAMLDRLIALPRDERAAVLRKLTMPQRRELSERFWLWAHPGQRMPPGNWRIWLLRAGRGFGKTRAGAEWVSQIAREIPEARIALVGATLEDARRVMVEGPAGLIAVAREGEIATWRRSASEVTFASGARAILYSAEAPETLRGPEHHAAWCDELGKWRGRPGEQAWDNLALTMRCGEGRIVVTTTPRTTRMMQRVMKAGGVHETRGRTADNVHLPASFVEAMLEEYGGTRLGRQELDGELIGEVEGALWQRTLLEKCRIKRKPKLVRVVVAVDPPAGSGGPSTGSGQASACGIVAVGLGRDGRGYVIEDASVAGRSPEGWARAVAACVARHGAERVVAEKNQGGEMVASVLLAADARLPLRLVSATRGKAARAEPVAALYERGKVRHVGGFAALEDELCGLMAGGGYEGPGGSPDRADALVWALTELMLRAPKVVRVRGL